MKRNLLAVFAATIPPAFAGGFGIGNAHGGLSAPTFVVPQDAAAEAPATPNEAAQKAQAQHKGGQVLSVERSGDGYRVKLLKNGEIIIVFIPD